LRADRSNLPARALTTTPGSIMSLIPDDDNATVCDARMELL
jgi:hypothetical protein